MNYKPLDPGKEKERPEAVEAREAFIFQKEEKQRQANLIRKQLQEDQSLQEGFGFLFKSIFQFVLFVAVGAALLIIGRDLQKTNSANGTALMFVGAVFVLKGMISFSGFRSK